MDTSVEVENLILNVLKDEHGEDAVHDPGTRGNATGFPKPAEWSAGIKTAAEIGRTVDSLIRDWIHQARGDAVSWAEIAEAIAQPHETTKDGATAAFIWVAPEPHWPSDPTVTTWRCASCREWVTDHGPRDLGYAAIEDGHAATCPRYQDPPADAGGQ